MFKAKNGNRVRSFWASEDTAQKVQQLATQRGTSMSKVIETALKEYLLRVEVKG